jgi:hypothetical protein
MDKLLKYEILNSKKLRIDIDLNPMHDYSIFISEFSDDWDMYLTVHLNADFKLKGFAKVIFTGKASKELILSDEDKLDIIDYIYDTLINHKDWVTIIEDIFSFDLGENEPCAYTIINKMKLAHYFKTD